MNQVAVYVINLQRRPERLQHFLSECEREHISTVTVWRAVDGLTHRFTDDELKLFKHSDLSVDSETARGCMGNQLSHLQIWEDFLRSDKPFALIFQDDVKLCDQFKHKLEHVINILAQKPEFPFVFIGQHMYALGSEFKAIDLEHQPGFETFGTVFVEDVILQMHPTTNPASLAYIVTKQGVSDYIAHIYQNGIQHATDRNLNEYLIARGQFVGTYPVLCTGNDRFKSDIFKYDHHAVTRDLLELLEDM